MTIAVSGTSVQLHSELTVQTPGRSIRPMPSPSCKSSASSSDSSDSDSDSSGSTDSSKPMPANKKQKTEDVTKDVLISTQLSQMDFDENDEPSPEEIWRMDHQDLSDQHFEDLLFWDDNLVEEQHTRCYETHVEGHVSTVPLNSCTKVEQEDPIEDWTPHREPGELVQQAWPNQQQRPLAATTLMQAVPKNSCNADDAMDAVSRETPSPQVRNPSMAVTSPAVVMQNPQVRSWNATASHVTSAVPIQTQAPQSTASVNLEEREWARDKIGRIRTRSQFDHIFKVYRAEGIWINQIKKYGKWQHPEDACLQRVSVTQFKIADTNIPDLIATKDYSEVEGITDHPHKDPMKALSQYLREQLPWSTYQALAELQTYSVLGDGTDGVVNLDVTSWILGHILCIRCWCKKSGLRSHMERDPLTKKFFLSMHK